MSDLLKQMLPMKFSNWESIPYSEGICCENEGGTVCWGYCNKHKFKHRKRGKYER